MKCTLDLTRTVFIHDHDGVHYRYEDNPDYVEFLGNAKAHAASSLLPHLTHEQAKAINKEFFYRCGDGSRGFYSIAQEHGHDINMFRLTLHHDYHRVAFERMVAECPEWIGPDPDVQECFAQLDGRVRHMVLSQGCPQYWINPNLQRAGIVQYFEHVLGSAELNFDNKAESPGPIEQGLRIMNAEARHSVFIEDTLKNLLIAKERFPDLCTVHICGDKKTETLPDYVDVQFASFRAFKQAVVQIHRPDLMLPAAGVQVPAPTYVP